MMEKPKVVIAMSGGVDSSVAAALLVEQGYQVTGMMLRLWSEPGSEESNRCCTPDAMALARRVAARMGIPFYAIDAKDSFYEAVVQSFVQGYAAGVTPNPCILCNRHIRWGVLLEAARDMGADFLATGHYARLESGDQGIVTLKRGVDARKDQSYVLSALTQDQLQHTLLPVGGYQKPEIREIARRYNFSVADRPDSQDLCFLGGGDYREFLMRHAPQVTQPGKIVTRRGEVLGDHQGLAFYTIGQRKGIRIAATEPYYVLEKDMQQNTLVVGTVDELGRSDLTAEGVNWVRGFAPAGEFSATVKIRYQSRELPGWITVNGADQISVRFEQPVRDITAGQRVVLYQEDVCLGGGTINS